MAALRDITAKFEAVSREYGGLGEAVSPIASRSERLLLVPGTEDTVRALHSALADLHTLAGWLAYDGLHTDTARWHFHRAVKLATDGKDPWAQVWALRHAVFMFREQGAPEDALKLYQMARAALLDVPGLPERLVLEQGSLASGPLVLSRRSGSARKPTAN